MFNDTKVIWRNNAMNEFRNNLTYFPKEDLVKVAVLNVIFSNIPIENKELKEFIRLQKPVDSGKKVNKKYLIE